MESAKVVLSRLREIGSSENRAGMARFGININSAIGVSVTTLRAVAREVLRPIKHDAAARHVLAAGLWESGIHEARILAALVDEPTLVTREQMEQWVAAFDSWDLCDQVCANLFDRTELGWDAVVAWAARDEEYVKRAAFALLAALAWHRTDVPDSRLEAYLPLIEREAFDERNFVKKAVNWALRQIGKRSPELNVAAVAVAERLRHSESRAARWIGSDAYRELTGDAVRMRLGLPTP
jgi:3-methyladenine DNA glycosylase AlkD